MEWLTLLAILLSPVIAVLITIWLQRRKENRDRKNNIFITLMMHRKSNPPAQDWVNSLNLIDIIFYDSRKVLQLWHDYYSLLGSANTDIELRERDHKYLELLSEMARELGYKNIQQIDIDKFYFPQALYDQTEKNKVVLNELINFLRNAASSLAKDKSKLVEDSAKLDEPGQ